MPIRMGMPQGATGLTDEIDSPAFAASLGLIIYGSQFQQEDIRIPLVGRVEIKGVITKVLGVFKRFIP